MIRWINFAAETAYKVYFLVRNLKTRGLLSVYHSLFSPRVVFNWNRFIPCLARMVLKSVLLFMLFVATALGCGGSGGGGGGGGSDSNCQTQCRTECYRIRNCYYKGCPVQESCRRICTNPCRTVKKRSVPEERVIVKRLPSKFTAYDSNRDGEITREEFAEALNLKQKDARELFEIIDTNSDQRITCDEFKMATKDVADGEPSCE